MVRPASVAGETEQVACVVHPLVDALAGDECGGALFGVLMLVLLYFVGAEQGATALVSGEGVHEWVHDARHLLGFPCH